MTTYNTRIHTGFESTFHCRRSQGRKGSTASSLWTTSFSGVLLTSQRDSRTPMILTHHQTHYFYINWDKDAYAGRRPDSKGYAQAIHICKQDGRCARTRKLSVDCPLCILPGMSDSILHHYPRGYRSHLARQLKEVELVALETHPQIQDFCPAFSSLRRKLCRLLSPEYLWERPSNHPKPSLPVFRNTGP